MLKKVVMYDESTKSKEPGRVWLRAVILFLLSLIDIGFICWFKNLDKNYDKFLIVLLTYTSILGGLAGGIVGSVSYKYSMLLPSTRSQQRTFNTLLGLIVKNIVLIGYWLLTGALLGIAILIALVVMCAGIVFIFSTLGLGVLLLLSTLLLLAFFPVILLVFFSVPAVTAFLLVISTEKAFDDIRILGRSRLSFKGYRFALTITLTLMVCFISSGVYIYLENTFIGDPEYARYAYEAEWRKLPRPPVEISRFVAAYPFEVYVETTTGDLLGCKRPSRFDVDCWYRAAELPKPIDQPCIRGLDEETGDSSLKPGLPENTTVTNSIQVRYCGNAGRYRSQSIFQYVLTSEGDVWQWGFDRFRLAQMPKLDQRDENTDQFGFIVGFLIGFVIWIIAMALIWRVSKTPFQAL